MWFQELLRYAHLQIGLLWDVKNPRWADQGPADFRSIDCGDRCHPEVKAEVPAQQAEWREVRCGPFPRSQIGERESAFLESFLVEKEERN